jgi:hypothetical protein
MSPKIFKNDELSLYGYFKTIQTKWLKKLNKSTYPFYFYNLVNLSNYHMCIHSTKQPIHMNLPSTKPYHIFGCLLSSLHPYWWEHANSSSYAYIYDPNIHPFILSFVSRTKHLYTYTLCHSTPS